MNAPSSTEQAVVLLSVRGIVKQFPGVKALDGVSLDVHRGEVHALVGENGAGKSTLMHILAGVFPPDAGRVDFGDQRQITIPNEHAAQRLGISIVFQERSLFGDLSVAENIFAGRQPAWGWGHIQRGRLWSLARRLLARIRLNVDPRARVNTLSPAQQQMVEIAKALSLDAQLLILDEPTAALTVSETQTLFDVIKQSAREGRSIIYISHRLEEVFQIADRVTVLKDGKWQGTLPIEQTSADDLILRMVGRQLDRGDGERTTARIAPPPVLEVRGLHDRPMPGRRVLRDVTFNVGRGEIVALAGLAGAGRTETALSVFGARRVDGGEIRIEGRRIAARSPRQAIAADIAYLPEDRKESGLFLEMDIAANTAVASLRDLGTWWINDRKARRRTDEFRQRLRIASHGVHQRVRTLSGGNQQKVLLARWLLLRPKLLIVDEPTRGVDVGAKAEVHRLLRELARAGTAVLLISSDLPEVLSLADRVVVLHEGVTAGLLHRDEANEEEIVRLASLGKSA